MNGLMKGVLGLMCAASLLAAPAARADIPPPDVCQTENEVCHNAGDNYNEDGICTQATCSRGSPSGQVTTYDCLKCEATTIPGAAGSTTVTETDKPKDDGGCSVGMLGSEKGVAVMMLGLGLVALGISRRRR